MKLKNLFLVAIILALFIPKAGAQTIEPASDNTKPTNSLVSELPSLTKAQEAQKRKAHEAKALSLTEKIIGQIGVLRLPENRLYAQAKLAHLIWKQDHQRSIELIGDAVSSLELIRQKYAEEDPDGRKYAEFCNSLVRTIAQSDEKFATELFHLIKQNAAPIPGSTLEGEFNRFELERGMQIAASDPKKAMEIAEQALDKDITNELVSILSQLRITDSEAATKLATDMVKKLKSLELDDNYLGIASSLYQITTAKPPKKTGEDDPNTSSLTFIDSASRRDLVTMLAKAVTVEVNSPLKNVYGDDYYKRDILRTLMSNAPEVERYARAQLPALKAKAAEYDKLYGQSEKAVSEYQEFISNSDVSTLLGFADKAKGNIKDSLYDMAVSKAMGNQDYDTARQIINQRIKDSTQRKALLEQADQSLFYQLVSEGKVDAALQVATRIVAKETRANLLVYLANSLLEKNDKKRALEIITAANSLIGINATNSRELESQIAIAEVYAKLDPKQSVAIFAAAIDQMNVVRSALVSINNFLPYGNDESIKEGEYVMGYNPYFTEVTRCAHSLANFIDTDFELVQATMDRFSADEIKISANLDFMEAILIDTTEASTDSSTPPTPSVSQE